MSREGFEYYVGFLCSSAIYHMCLPEDVPAVLRRYPCDEGSTNCLSGDTAGALSTHVADAQMRRPLSLSRRDASCYMNAPQTSTAKRLRGS